jgi:raffinose/stachyose/melibiose transport system permease protein
VTRAARRPRGSAASRPAHPLTPYLFVAPAFLLFLVIVLLPVVGTFGLSFTRWDGSGPIVFRGLANYTRAFKDHIYLSSYVHVLIYVVATIVLEVGLGLALAGLVSARPRTAFYRVAFFVPVILPMVLVAVVWAFVLNPDFGLLNAGLSAVGLDSWQHLWLGDSKTALLSISVVSGWVFAGFYMAIFYAGFQRIPAELIESARLDGAGEWRIFRSIKVPLITSVRDVTILLCITGGIQVFDLVFVLTNGGPYNSTEVPTTYLVKTVFRDLDVGYGAAQAVLLTIVVTILGLAFTRVRRSRPAAEF